MRDSASEYARGVRLSRRRQFAKISNVGEDIEPNHDTGAERERERKIAFWIAHFRRGETHAGPRVGGAQRTDHPSAEYAKRRNRNGTRAEKRRLTAEVRMYRGRILFDQ